jgi:hypothetical protein
MAEAAFLAFDTADPPPGLSRPLAALWWLRKGGFALGAEWHKAHALCQMQEGDAAHDMVHALTHWIEGDEANAGYWYRRCRRRRAPTIEAEWQALVDELASVGERAP